MLKKTLFFTLALMLLFGCKPTSEKVKSKKNSLNITDSTMFVKVSSKQISNDSISRKQVNQKVCSCQKKSTKIVKHPDVSFSNRTFNKDTLEKWNRTKALRIKTIQLKEFDTIPIAFKRFENVETLILSKVDWRPITIQDIFPKLKKLKVLGKLLDLSHEPDWLEKIEVIHAEKSQIVGLESFNKLPNLIEFNVGGTSFDNFPSDFNSLQCLKYFKIHSSIGGTIDLNEIDLSNMPCLEFVQFHSWSDNIKGIPFGIDQIKTVKIFHSNLTKEEKNRLKEDSE